MSEEKLDAAEDMPWVAYGTMENDVHEVSPASLEGHVAMAIEAGARHFDCAELYESTEHVGKVRSCGCALAPLCNAGACAGYTGGDHHAFVGYTWCRIFSCTCIRP